MKKVLLILLCISLTFTAVACSNSAVSASDTAASQTVATTAPTESAAPIATTSEGKQFTIGYAAFDLTAENNMRISKQLEAACDAAGVKLATLTAEGDANTQVQQVENFIVMGVNALIIYPVDPKVVADSMKQAREAGIYVINADQLADKDSYDVGISVDMADLGVQCDKMASDWIDKTFPDAKPGTVKTAVFGTWASEQFASRCNAMLDLPSYNEKAVIVEKYDIGQNYAFDLPQDMSICIQKHPDISAILSFTDTFAMLTDEVIMQNASTLDISKIGSFTVDWSSAGMQKIKASETDGSTIRGTIASNLDIGNLLVDVALQKFDKSKLNADNVLMGPLVPITSDNVDQHMNG